MNKRTRKFLESMESDSYLVTNPDNVFYLSGFDGEGFLYISPDTQLVITDSRYTVQARGEAPEYEVIDACGGYFKPLKDYVKKGEKLAFEKNHISFANYEAHLVPLEAELIPTGGQCEKLRMYKDSEEIELICTATDILKETAEMFGCVQDGTKECEFANLIDFNMRSYAHTKIAFDTIVAFGDNAACPHHKPTDRIIEQGSMLKIDYGVSFKHYCADVTRTVFIGKPDDKFKEIYNIVKDAKDLAISEMAPGKTGGEIDKVARDYIAKYGYGDCFGHSLGHGIGVNVHDPGGLSPKNETELKPGFVTSVEPGIYIEGWGGVRLEDDILITQKGCMNLTSGIRQYDWSDAKALKLEEKKQRLMM